MDLQYMERWKLSSQVIGCTGTTQTLSRLSDFTSSLAYAGKNRKSPANSSERSPGNVIRNRDLSGQHKKVGGTP